MLLAIWKLCLFKSPTISKCTVDAMLCASGCQGNRGEWRTTMTNRSAYLFMQHLSIYLTFFYQSFYLFIIHTFLIKTTTTPNVKLGSRGSNGQSVGLVIRGCGFESRLRQALSTTEVRSLSKALNPQLLPGRCSVGCPLLQVCVHLYGLNAENTFHCWLYSV